MVVTAEMRDEWKERGTTGVHEMLSWVDRVHDYRRTA